MNGTIFYSWQSDCSMNRNFIESALRRAITELNREETLTVEPRLDRALEGAAGAVRIDHDILLRIDACDMIVADVTLVTALDQEERPSPNPNVIFELGYAVKRLGWNRVILPFNEALGPREQLPFDLDKNRLLRFSLAEDTEEDVRAEVRAEVVWKFKDAITAIMGLPALQDLVRDYLDKVNPEILNRVRSGDQVVPVMISILNQPRLQELLRHRGINDLIEARSNGNVTLSGGPGNTLGDSINDLAFGAMHGFDFTFKNTAEPW